MISVFHLRNQFTDGGYGVFWLIPTAILSIMASVALFAFAPVTFALILMFALLLIVLRHTSGFAVPLGLWFCALPAVFIGVAVIIDNYGIRRTLLFSHAPMEERITGPMNIVPWINIAAKDHSQGEERTLQLDSEHRRLLAGNILIENPTITRRSWSDRFVKCDHLCRELLRLPHVKSVTIKQEVDWWTAGPRALLPFYTFQPRRFSINQSERCKQGWYSPRAAQPQTAEERIEQFKKVFWQARHSRPCLQKDAIQAGENYDFRFDKDDFKLVPETYSVPYGAVI